jgi:DNA-binding CsgD family transcriptional regulator
LAWWDRPLIFVVLADEACQDDGKESASMATDSTAPLRGDDRLLETLQRLLMIRSPELRPALDQACSLVAEVLEADKVDVFLYEADTDTLVAMGTSDTPMGRRQHQLGLNRQPLSNDGPAAIVFRTGESRVTGAADRDPDELRGVVEALGVRSEIDVPLEVNDLRRGVLQADSSEPDRFSERDVRFLEAVAGWIGVLTHRAELMERHERDAVDRGRREAGEEVGRLTHRQLEVVICIAEGLTNEQIAQRLVLTPGTVANHLEHILRRLDLTSRTRVAVWAVERGLYRSDRREDAPFRG